MAQEKSDANLSTCEYPLKYMMEAMFFGSENSATMDIGSFSVIRTPISKTSSFSSLTVNVGLSDYLNIQEHISRNEYPNVLLKCWICKNQDVHENIYPPKVEDVFEKNYKIINMTAMEKVRYQSPHVLVNLLLVNPVLLYLQGTNGFNEIFEDITALDAVKKYESWLSGTFGSGAFQFTHIGEDYEKNDWMYEQILTRNTTDLMIPNILINEYKVWHKFGYYFFDDFRLDKTATADITGYLINLGDKNKFPTDDVYSYGDIAMGAKLISEHALHDPFNALYQKQPSIITRNYEMQFGFRKATNQRELPQITADVSSGTHGSERGSSIIKTQISLKNIVPTEETMIYAPDDHAPAMDRFDKVSKQLRDDMMSVETYLMRDSSIDFLQFGKRYNFNPLNIQDYDYIPIAICNMFVRDSGKMPILVHNVKFQVFRYRPTEEQDRINEKQY